MCRPYGAIVYRTLSTRRFTVRYVMTSLRDSEQCRSTPTHVDGNSLFLRNYLNPVYFFPFVTSFCTRQLFMSAM
jgi:hypothetical protein